MELIPAPLTSSPGVAAWSGTKRSSLLPPTARPTTTSGFRWRWTVIPWWFGAPGDDDNGADSGSVYVFTRDPDSGEWRQGAKLTASDGDALDYFGYSVAVSGNTVLVGAYLDDDENNDLEDSGSAYVFVEPAEGWVDTTTQTTKLTPSEPADDDQFGISVALDGKHGSDWGARARLRWS